ncbi:Hsp20/alpha crystallin family protein [Acidimangrovimonas sediminis]|uniref:Hsp20/alpha crystallin family protein n=1 Tax=Acidimangrovimonas sediminis TaxID=2056283 RepID=UPI000C8077EF|nr:Hsp20/alpha crystallin family protein [Acidimangrovimonas sediminis]
MNQKTTTLTVNKDAAPDLPAAERWAPFDTLRREVDRLFEDFTPSFWRRPSMGPQAMMPRAGGWPMLPAVDLRERDGTYDITAELPGIDPEAIEVKLTDGILTIRGEKKEATDEENADYRLSERRYGAFQRSFTLPDSVDPDRIEAAFANGVLTVTLPKTEKARASEKRIEVKAA